MRSITIACAALILASCTYQSQVPAVEGATLASVGARQPGRYVALVQTGGWDMTTQIDGIKCSFNTYKADLNPAWESEMKGALSAAVEKVDFESSVLAASELKQRGYDAQIAITQSNASSKMGIVSHFFRADAVSEASLEGILVISYPDGTQQQQALQGHGTSKEDIFGCGQAGPAIANAGGAAVRDIVERTITTTKLLLAQKTKQ